MSFRPVQPMQFPGVAPARDSVPTPDLRMVAPTDLMVDDAYQRELSHRSVNLIKRIIEGFSWARFKPPIVVPVDGALHIVDGQHTAIAAASAGVPAMPVLVVSIETLSDRARAFVGHNRDRINVGPYDIHRALVASGDEDEVEIAACCAAAQVVICRAVTQQSAPGRTASVVTLRRIYRRRGKMRLRQILTVLREGRATMGELELLAAEHVLCGSGTVDERRVGEVIRAAGAQALADARAKAVFDRERVWKSLAAVWTRRLEGRR